MKIYIRAEIVDDLRAKLADKFDEVVYDPWTKDGKRFYPDEMAEKMAEVNPDVLITELDQINDKVLNAATNLKLIVDCRSTPENIDVPAVTAHNVPLIHTPARNAEAVAEMLVGTLVMQQRQIIPARQWILDGKWVPGTTPYYIWKGHELYSQTIGFVGFGAVARKAAHLLEAFGCKMYFYDPYVEHADGPVEKTDLATIFKKSNIVSVHLPVTKETERMIDAKYFDLMNKNGLFVNTSRSAVVNNDDLYDALVNKQISGAILDVLDVEPPKTKDDMKLALLDNVICTPHICGSTYEVVLHQSEIAVQSILNFLNKDYKHANLMNPTVIGSN
ncbi:2-hydroxyacid dehydrogenase [Lactobacillus sp. ESL0679]|uniref:2-hydroxyacid dehydrogenase n=1 Tax=unclassified Lactobacillus TaxID=2620435 RepID=UPI0023F7C04B|nr:MULTISPECIES: 2-hydroxyacid dehydrogenase [unclassified Lactobacillus]MDF7682702.1 2-hydroxyacid dehydrogenase [Lactobacillus sp. ESL0679]WEV36116.1 2-hydroxyacid dehydrogenase [Lactobacillus sp. ESL0677]